MQFENSEKRLNGKEIFEILGIKYGAEYYDKSNKPSANYDAREHGIFEGIPNFVRESVISELEKVAYTISGIHHDYPRVGLDVSKRQEDYITKLFNFVSEFVYSIRDWYAGEYMKEAV